VSARGRGSRRAGGPGDRRPQRGREGREAAERGWATALGGQTGANACRSPMSTSLWPPLSVHSMRPGFAGSVQHGRAPVDHRLALETQRLSTGLIPCRKPKPKLRRRRRLGLRPWISLTMCSIGNTRSTWMRRPWRRCSTRCWLGIRRRRPPRSGTTVSRLRCPSQSRSSAILSWRLARAWTWSFMTIA